MKIIISSAIATLGLILTSCTQLTTGPMGSWRGMDGTDVIKLRLENSGKCELEAPSQKLTGTWQPTGPGQAMVYLYESGTFRMSNDNQALFNFSNRRINLNRIYESKPVAKPVSKPKPRPKPVKKPEAPRRESYHLNQIP